MTEKIYDMLVVGGGPGGYTAALYAARAGLGTLVLERMAAGGQMALTGEIENYPGFAEGVEGFTLGEEMRRGAERFGAESLFAAATALTLEGDIKRVETDKGILRGKTVVLAMGADPRRLGLKNEAAWTGRGVSYCAHCDGMFYRDKTVAVVGGGNSAAEDALLLSRICRRVILVHRRDTLRAAKVYREALQARENVVFHWNSEVAALLGTEKLNGLCLRHVQTGETAEVACDGVFVSIGRIPATDPAKGLLPLDEAGYILADESTRTPIPGVFAVGDVRTKSLRQIVTATADGAVAAYEAERYLAEGAGRSLDESPRA